MYCAPVIPQRCKKQFEECLISEYPKLLYAALDWMSESKSRRNRFAGEQRKCPWRAARFIKLSAALKKCRQIPLHSDCTCSSTFKGKFCVLRSQNEPNIIWFILLLGHFELSGVQKFSAFTEVTKILSTFMFDSICEQGPRVFGRCQLTHLGLRFTLHFLPSVNTIDSHHSGLINTDGEGRTMTNPQEQEAATPGCTCLLSLSGPPNTPVYCREAPWILVDWHWRT